MINRRERRGLRAPLHVRFGGALLMVLAVCAATPAHAEGPAENPSALEGIPHDVRARIIDITTLYPDRSFYRPTQAAPIATHVIHQRKETPWHHAYVRPHQRRLARALTVTDAANAIAEIEPDGAGRLRYKLRIAGSGSALHGSLGTSGALANDDFTQGRGSRTETGVAVSGGWRGTGARGDLGASWSTTSLNWRRMDETLSARDRTLVHLSARGAFGPPGRARRTRVSAEVFDYKLDPASGVGGVNGAGDAITEAHGSVEIDLSAAARPWTVALGGTGRRTESTTDATATDTSMARVSVADRFVPILGGVASWRVGAALYSDPGGSDGSGQSTVAAPFKLAWTTRVSRLHLRVHGGYDVEQPGLALYSGQDHVLVNPDLAAITSWGGGASVWARFGSALVSGKIDATDVAGLPVWVESSAKASADSGVIAWTPQAVDATLVSWRMRLDTPYGPHATLSVTVSGESAEPGDSSIAHLPYRPSLTAGASAAYEVPGLAILRVSADRVGERRRTTTDDSRLEAYTRLHARATKTLTSAVDVFITGYGTVGTYQTFASEHGAPLHALNQSGVGVGITGRI